MVFHKTFGCAACAFALLVWSATFASTRVLLEEFSALEINVVRFALAWFALVCAAAMGRRRMDAELSMPRQVAAPHWLFPAMGFTGIFAYQFLENCAIYYTNASNVAILVSFGPILTAVMARVLTQDRSLSVRFVAGSIVAVSGVVIVSLNGVENFRLRPLGDLMTLGAMASWGFYSVLADKANRIGVAPIVAVRKSFGWAVAMMLPLALWGTTDCGYVALDGSYSVTLDCAENAERFSSAVNLGNLIFLGVVASAASFVLWSHACKVLGVVRTTATLYLTPIIGAALASVFLKERLTWLSVCGGAVILVGVVIANMKRGGGK